MYINRHKKEAKLLQCFASILLYIRILSEQIVYFQDVIRTHTIQKLILFTIRYLRCRFKNTHTHTQNKNDKPQAKVLLIFHSNIIMKCQQMKM